MQPEKTLWGQPIRRRNIKQIQILGILYPNVPWSCRPYQQFNRYHLCRWHHRAYRRWGTGRKHLLQQYVSSLSDRKQRWHWRAGTSRRTFIRVKFSRSNRSVSNALTSRNSKRTAGNKTKRKRKYWSTIPSDDDIPFLEREADFFLGRDSRLRRSIPFNSRIVFS